MAIVIMLVGVPGSGKSFDASSFKGVKIVSSDQMRIERGGDQSTHTNDSDFWSDVRTEVVRYLQAGHDVVFDATNVHPGWRSFNTRFFLEHGASKVVARVYATPLQTCLARNKLRKGAARIDEEVIRRMFLQLQDHPPKAGEGGIAEVQVVVP